MEIGNVSIGVGYELDQQAPRRFEAQQTRLASSTAKFQTSLGRLASSAAAAGAGVEGVVPAGKKFISVEEELASVGIKTTSAISAQVTQLERLKKAFQGDAAVVSQLDNRINGLNSQLRGSAGSSRQATNAVIQLGRGLEDASFGFVGVANNIPIALEALARTKDAAKTTGTTLIKSLGSALLGPAGLIFAFQAVTFGVLTFGDQISDVFNKVRGKAVKTAKEIKKELGEILKFGDLGIGEVTFDNVGQIEASRKETERLLALQEEVLKTAQRRVDANKQIEDFGTEQDRLAKERLRGFQEVAKQEEQRRNDLRATLDLLDQEIDKFEELKRLEGVLVEVGGRPEDRTVETPDIAPVAVPLEVDFDVDTTIADLVRQIEQVPLPPIDTKEAESAFDRYARKIVQLQRQIDAGILTESQEVSQSLSLLTELFKGLAAEGVDISTAAFAAYREELAKLQEAQAATKESTEETIEAMSGQDLALAAIGASVSDLGTAFVETFADALTGVEKLEDGLKGLQNTLRRVLSKLISAGFSAGLASITGGGSFATNFLGQFGINSVPKFAEGGVVTRSTFGQIGEAGPEAIIPLDRFDTMFDRALATAMPEIETGELATTMSQAISRLQIDAPQGPFTGFSPAATTSVTESPRFLQDLSGAVESAMANMAPVSAPVVDNGRVAPMAGQTEVKFTFDELGISFDRILFAVREAERRSSRDYGFN